MIALLGCSISLSANECGNDNINTSTGEGEVVVDSVLIAYNDLRIANSKLIELDYEKQINSNLRDIIRNDSIVIKDYTILNENINKDYKRTIKERNIAIGTGIVFFIISIILLVK